MNKKKGIFLVLIMTVISGFVVFISKYSVSVVNPYVFTGWKNIIVALLMVGWLLMMKDWKILKSLSRAQWGLLTTIGLIGGGIPFLLYFKGLSLTAKTQAAFIHKSMFLFIFVLAVFFLKEKISRNLLIAGLFLFLGNILLLKLTAVSFNWGDLMILIATVFWAAENVLSKYLLKELPSRIVIWARMFFGSCFIVIFLLATNQAGLMLSLNLEQIGWTMITSVLLFAALASWYTGLQYIDVSLAAVILLLASPITTLLSLFNGQALAVNQLFGIFLIGGVMVWYLKKNLIGEF